MATEQRDFDLAFVIAQTHYTVAEQSIDMTTKLCSYTAEQLVLVHYQSCSYCTCVDTDNLHAVHPY